MIEARGLTKRYGEVTAADDVTFTVAPGEVVGLLGPNGAGKTTVLRMLAGVLTPTAGEARIAGHGAEGEAFELKRSLGFLTGDTALYQRLTPREVLRYFGRLHEIPEQELDRRIEALVDRFRLRDFADRPCGKLSAGQKQRANIARSPRRARWWARPGPGPTGRGGRPGRCSPAASDRRRASRTAGRRSRGAGSGPPAVSYTHLTLPTN